jgi:NarL family two-component system response regulator LiaR
METESDKKITILIADDHAIVRQGLRTLLELMPDFKVLGEVENGKSAVAFVTEQVPDVILMDLKMPEMDGIQATQMICKSGAQTKIIALTSFLEAETIIAAVQAGATSILLKDVSPNDLVEAIRATVHGEVRLHHSVAKTLMAQVATKTETQKKVNEQITEREMDVLKLVAKGMSNNEIATELVLSEKTIKSHISSLLGKLGLNDRTQLAIYAYKNGLVTNLS